MFYLLFKRKSKQKSLRVILFYILYCIFNEASSFYLQNIHSQNVIYLFAIFTLVEYSFFCYFIYSVLPKNYLKKGVPVFWIGYLIFAFIDYFYFSKGQEFDSFAIGVESIIIILLCIGYLFIQLRRSTTLLVNSTFDFWVIIAFLIYFAGTFFLYIMTESMRESISFQIQYTIINISFNILKNILLCVAMTMKLNNHQKVSSLLPDLDDDIFIHKKQ